MTSSLLPHLRELLDDATADLPAVSVRKMFGCDCFFARDKIFAMVWKEGRLAVKLLSEEDHAAAMAEEGSEPWNPGGKMKPRHWVLLPESVHDEPKALRKWTRLAHEHAASAPRSPKKTAAKKTAATKTAAKTTAAKKTAATKTAAKKTAAKKTAAKKSAASKKKPAAR